MTNEELWRAALGEIELSISKANFITWFKNTSVLSNSGGRVVIGVPNGFAKEWLENKYNIYILRAPRNIQSDIKEVACAIETGQEGNKNEQTIDAIIPPKKHIQTKPFIENTLQISQENNLNPKPKTSARHSQG